ncbi:MAG: hypothetical protein KDE25_01835 [Novosphingobium sp.]|nr:hypothetical protein [Novosphingobium sp.]
MGVFTPNVIGLIFGTVVGQLVGVGFLPASKGFTEPLPTIFVLASFSAAMFFMARLIHAGVNLGMMVPIMSVLVPMGALAVGVFVYGEAISLLKFGIVFVAVCLIGVANLV